MKFRKGLLLPLAAAALLLICGVWLYTARSVHPSETPGPVKINAFSAEDIASVCWVDDLGETIRLIRNAEGWVYASDIDFPLNQDIADSLANRLADLSGDKQIHGMRLSDFGLDSPDFSVSVVLKDDTQLTLSEAYRDAASGRLCILSSLDKTRLCETESSLASIFSYNLSDLMTVEALPEIKSAAEITLSGPEGTLRLHRTENRNARWLDEDGSAVAPEHIEALLQTASGLRWLDCVNYHAESSELADYGLETPQLRVRIDEAPPEDGTELSASVGNSTLWSLDFGIQDASGNYYACLTGSRQVYTVASGSVTPFLYAMNGSLSGDPGNE